MRSWLHGTLLLAAAALAGSVAGGAEGESTPRLRFDPFERPDLRGTARSADAPPGAGSVADWEPVLSATLVGAEQSYANLGGVVLKVGEQTHGYRLKEVRIWEAVFEKDGADVVLYVVPPAAMEAP